MNDHFENERNQLLFERLKKKTEQNGPFMNDEQTKKKVQEVQDCAMLL